MWYLIVSIPDLCTLTYFVPVSLNKLWVILHAFLSSADFFLNQFFRKTLSGIPSESADFVIKVIFFEDISGIPSEFQTDQIQIKPDVFLRTDLDPNC